MFIILTSAQAQRVRGITLAGSALEPVALANGTEWVLPVAVLPDPGHAKFHDYLAALPQRAVRADEFPQPKEPI